MNQDLNKIKKEEQRAMSMCVLVFTLTALLILGVIFFKLKVINLSKNNYLGLVLMLNGFGSLVVATQSFKFKKKIKFINSNFEIKNIKKIFYKVFFTYFCIPYLASVAILSTTKDFKGAVTMLAIMIFTWIFIYIYDWKNINKGDTINE